MRLSFFQGVLLATAAGLAVFLTVELSLLIPDGSDADSRVATDSLLEPLDPGSEVRLGFSLPPRKSLRAFVERPLFEKSRRASGESIAKDESGEVLDISLIGTVIQMSETLAVLQAQGASPVRAR